MANVEATDTACGQQPQRPRQQRTGHNEDGPMTSDADADVGADDAGAGGCGDCDGCDDCDDGSPPDAPWGRYLLP